VQFQGQASSLFEQDCRTLPDESLVREAVPMQQIAKSEVGHVYVTNKLVRRTFGQHAFERFAAT
jgi:hypothetical protein